MFKRKFFYFFILLILIIIFPLVFSERSKLNDDKKTIVFWTLQLSSFDKYINNIISQYENTHPNIKIKWIDVPYSEGEKRTLAAVLTDNPPDLVNLTPDFSLLLAQKNALYTFDKNKLEQFQTEIINSLKYNDKYFGIPFYATSAVTLYNTEIINAYPKKYNDLFSLPVIENKYITMINFSENDTLLKLLNKYDINSPSSINSEKSVKLFSQFKKLYDMNLIPKESVTQTHRDSLEQYMSGQIAFLITGANFLNMIKENAPSVYKNTKILPQLTGDNNLYDYSLMNFVIPLKSKNKDIALDFALFFTNKTNQIELAKITTILPVNKFALEDDFFHISDNNDLNSQARLISASQLNNLINPLQNQKNKKELNTLCSNAIQDILINNAPIKQTLDKLSDNWRKINN